MSEKKNLSLLVLKILKLYSSSLSPLSQTNICKILKDDYEITCDKRTLRSALSGICDIGFPIKSSENGFEGWYIETDFTPSDAKALYLALSTSTYIDEKVGDGLKEKLSMLFKPLAVDTLSYKTKNQSIDSLNILNTLEATGKAIREHRLMSFSVKSFNENGKSRLERSDGFVKIYLVRPVEVICAYGTLFLFCELGNTQMYRFFSIEKMYDARAESIDLCPSEAFEAPLPLNYLEARSLMLAERQKAVVRINSRYLSEFTDCLGDVCEILYTNESTTELAVFTNLTALKRLILSFGSYAEAVSPTKLRRSIALELKEAISHYPEFRRLHGSI